MTADRISICICTFKRPALLARLLDAAINQATTGEFSFEIVVVDNDSNRSSEEVVSAYASKTNVPISYDCEPVQNISLARNRAIRNATGNLVACIDDDERPVHDWLVRLHNTLKGTAAAGVLGPVVPDLPSEAPRWLARGGFLDRRRHPTGTWISSKDARSGNVLLYRAIFVEGGLWFDPAFGRSGGEDSVFFAQHFQTGGKYLWCDEAIAYEAIPPDRWTVSYHLRRRLLSGTVTGERMRAGEVPARGILGKNIAFFVGCALLSVPALILPRHLWVKITQKACYSGGMITAYCGLSMVRQRS